MTAIEWLDHASDIGFRASGATIDVAFCEAARALFSLMFDIETIRPRTEHVVRVAATSQRGLLVEWLSELLAQRDLVDLIFSRFDVRVSGDNRSGFSAVGVASGEPFDPTRHVPETEVKGISYLGLEVAHRGDAWIAQCVVDV